MEKLTRLDWGNDSTVYRSGCVVVKVYDGLMGKIGTDSTLKVLRQYHDDTLRARELFSTTSIGSFTLGRNSYRTTVSVIPQGTIRITPVTDTDKPPKIKFEEYVISDGQRFIEGMSYKAIDYYYDYNIGESVFYSDINTFTSSMERSIDSINSILNKRLNIPFEIDPYNIKPFLDKEKHTIDLVITDLAANITTTYR